MNNHRFPTRATFPTAQGAIAELLNRWSFDRYVTLTFNDLSLASSSSRRVTAFMKDKLREWDGRINRKLIGRNWAKMPEFRTFCFFAPEKVGSNPHWHGLVRFFDADEEEHLRQSERFDEWAQALWVKLVPSGTVDIQMIDSQVPTAKYVAKSLGYDVNYDHFVLPDEFQ